MRYAAEPAFVLHARDWRETSALVEILTRDHGRITLLARGTRGAKRQPVRAALAPFQAIQFDGVQRGELARLERVEALDALPQLDGEQSLAAFYLNELVLRLTPRLLPQPELFPIFARTRSEIVAGQPLAWTLRRFERDFLDASGFGFDWSSDERGEPVDPAARYALMAESGLRRVVNADAMRRRQLPTGRILLALATDGVPVAEDQSALRLAMRQVLLHHLGGRGLQSWTLAAALLRLRDNHQS